MSTSVGGVNVSRETIADLERFSELVTKWTPKINLIGRGSIENIWERHIVDSVQLYRFAPAHYTKWVDMGSGAGFPGIVLAIIGRMMQPDAEFILIESDQRKATFLRTAAREIDIQATVKAERIEDVAPEKADVVSARALTSLSGLMPFALQHLKPEGVALFHKGRQSQQEVADAQKNWSFDLEDYASFTDPEARILAIQRIKTLGS